MIEKKLSFMNEVSALASYKKYDSALLCMFIRVNIIWNDVQAVGAQIVIIIIMIIIIIIIVKFTNNS